MHEVGSKLYALITLNSLSTVSRCLAILASIAVFPPDMGLPKASTCQARSRTVGRTGLTRQSTLGVVLARFPLKRGRPRFPPMNVVRVVLVALGDTIVLSVSHTYAHAQSNSLSHK
jgi:hypothetical protein